MESTPATSSAARLALFYVPVGCIGAWAYMHGVTGQKARLDLERDLAPVFLGAVGARRGERRRARRRRWRRRGRRWRRWRRGRRGRNLRRPQFVLGRKDVIEQAAVTGGWHGDVGGQEHRQPLRQARDGVVGLR
eukprot:scaffold27008_cov67-Phaeocystis_antarctica.AAC.9